MKHAFKLAATLVAGTIAADHLFRRAQGRNLADGHVLGATEVLALAGISIEPPHVVALGPTSIPVCSEHQWVDNGGLGQLAVLVGVPFCLLRIAATYLNGDTDAIHMLRRRR